ncbi:MAG: hypothetical protein U5L00_04375 [Desulfovermiculus sp.]|nr:hypothetical protein [Desulfovermiculus sp.]
MDYKYTVVYRLEGISNSNLDEDKTVYQDEDLGISVVLTSDVNRHCLSIDRGMACASLFLRGMFGDEKMQKLPTAIDSEIAKTQEERLSKNKSGAYAVIIISGHAELDIKDNLHRETDQFRITFDSIDKESIRNQHKERIYAIVTSLAISTRPEYHAERIASGIYFLDANDKPLYTYTLQGGRARLILAKPVGLEKEMEISRVVGLSNANMQLKTPFRLLTQSLETTQDNLRAFMSAWSALEILTNKVFHVYEEKFIAGIVDDHNSHGVNNFLERIKDAMKDKYRLTDKFSLVASFLSIEITEDIELFKSMKRVRDNISHGKEFDEETLPVEDARKLASKYLKNHMLATEYA